MEKTKLQKRLKNLGTTLHLEGRWLCCGCLRRNGEVLQPCSYKVRFNCYLNISDSYPYLDSLLLALPWDQTEDFCGFPLGFGVIQCHI
jgi:hypothetical protein